MILDDGDGARLDEEEDEKLEEENDGKVVAVVTDSDCPHGEEFDFDLC